VDSKAECDQLNL